MQTSLVLCFGQSTTPLPTQTGATSLLSAGRRPLEPIWLVASGEAADCITRVSSDGAYLDLLTSVVLASLDSDSLLQVLVAFSWVVGMMPLDGKWT